VTTPVQAQPRAVQVSAAAAYVAASSNLRTGLLGFVSRAFRLRGAWNRVDQQWFAQLVAPQVVASQRYLAALTDQYIASDLSRQTGSDVAPVGFELPDDLRGAPAEEVYGRPYVQLWTDLGRGVPFDTAVSRAERRAVVLAHTDYQMARVRASRLALEGQPGVRFWRRVPTGERNCLLCLVASTQRYRKQDLAAIHPQCDCIVEGIPGDDPGHVIDPVLLEQVHRAVEDAGLQADRGGRAPDYRHLIVTREHGEIGPVLTLRGQNFTSAADLNRGDTPQS
jgi:hypothetical protein